MAHKLEFALEALTAGATPGKITAFMFELFGEVKPNLIQPHIIYDFPLAVSPLSKQKPDEPDWVERFEFYIGGFEVGNAFSELNDPDEQRKRFEDQLKERDRGDDEAHHMDEDYVRALGYGLPPTAGEGIASTASRCCSQARSPSATSSCSRSCGPSPSLSSPPLKPSPSPS